MNIEENLQPQFIKMLYYLAENSPYYKSLFKKHNINPAEILKVTDLQKIPFTTKEDLQVNNAEFICVSKDKLVDHVSSSGTTGKPVFLALSEKDLDRLAMNEFNSFKTAGLNDEDVIQIMATIDRQFMAGLAYFLGARKLGAGVIRTGNGIPGMQWDSILNLKPTVIIAVPSFILKLIGYAEKHGIDYKNSSVKKAICIGEPIRNADFSLNVLGKKINEKWKLQLHSTYASSEMATSFTECEAFNGGHLQPELLYAEIIDNQGMPMKPGETGELVVTTLQVETMPLLRYKTGDICAMHVEPCICGNKSLRLGPLIGRKNQMIKYKGTSLFPGAIYEVLDNMDAIENYQVEVQTNEIGTDHIFIRLALKPGSQITKNELQEVFKAKLRVVPELFFHSPEELTSLLMPEDSRKMRKFVDKRN